MSVRLLVIDVASISSCVSFAQDQKALDTSLLLPLHLRSVLAVLSTTVGKGKTPPPKMSWQRLRFLRSFATAASTSAALRMAVPVITSATPSESSALDLDSAASTGGSWSDWFHDWKTHRVGNYENKLRKYSHPYKVLFHVQL